MKDLLKLHNDQPGTPKSIFDYTDTELTVIDDFQNRNRGWEEDDEIPLEDDFDYFEYLD